MTSRAFGSILLIIAMSIGGGLLSLPVVTAESGFFNSTLLLIIIWLITTISSLFILEVCLRLPKDNNLITMARDTLGRSAQGLTWFFYLIMLYCIMCVYIAGGTDLIRSFWNSFHINMPSWVNSLLFSGILGCFVWRGIKLVDHTNRLLMTGKMIVYGLLVLTIAPLVHFKHLPSGSFHTIPQAVMPAIFSFGYAIIIPTLCSYLENDVKELRRVVVIGSFIPLLCFIIWNYIVQGTLSQQQLIEINHSGQVISALNAGLSALGNPWITTITHLFTTICLLTAFLAVSLSLSDVIANGIQKKKEGKNKWLIYGLTFLPPLAIVLFRPNIFITAIRYAGILVVALSIVLPLFMVWSSRRNSSLACNTRYQVPGQSYTIMTMLIAVVILVYVISKNSL